MRHWFVLCSDSEEAREACGYLNNQLCSPVDAARETCSGLPLDFQIDDFTQALEKLKKTLSTNVTFSDTLSGEPVCL